MNAKFGNITKCIPITLESQSINFHGENFLKLLMLTQNYLFNKTAKISCLIIFFINPLSAMTGNLPNPKAFSKWQGRQSIHEVTCIVNYKLVTVNYKLNISNGVAKHILLSHIN